MGPTSNQAIIHQAFIPRRPCKCAREVVDGVPAIEASPELLEDGAIERTKGAMVCSDELIRDHPVAIVAKQPSRHGQHKLGALPLQLARKAAPEGP
jgi:hypothetical protein